MLLKVGRMTFPYRPILVCAVTAAGCVTTGTYNRKVAELEKLRSDENQAAAERERSLQSQIAALTTDRDAVRRQLDEMTALADALRKRLEKLGQNVDKLTGEKGQLSQALSEANLRLAELRKQEAAAEARAATFRTLVEKFRSMIDSGQLKVVIRDGRMLIAMPNDVLFDTGKTDIKPDGRAALVQVAKVLITIPNRRFEVAGHTELRLFYGRTSRSCPHSKCFKAIRSHRNRVTANCRIGIASFPRGNYRTAPKVFHQESPIDVTLRSHRCLLN